MAMNAPKCAVNMEQRLAALRRDQEIDGLRTYLIKYNLFPRNRDPENSPIRTEELKELVKHWKLHRQRGFWRDHPDKDDLVRALLQHIKSEAANKKRRQEAHEKYHKASNAGDYEGKHRDFTIIFNKDVAGAASTTDTEQSDKEKALAAAKKKNFGGDLFYQRGEYDEGMIYLSRIDRSKFASETRNPCMDLLGNGNGTSSPTPLSHLLLGGASESGNANAGSSGESRKASALLHQVLELASNSNNSASTNMLTRDMKLKCAEGIYNISCHHGFELQIIREGALATILSILKVDDTAIRLYAAASLLNLTTSPPSRSRLVQEKSNRNNPVATATLTSSSSTATMMPASVLSLAIKDLYARMIDDGVLGALLELSHTPNTTVKTLCARTLFRFTVDETHHFQMVHEGCVVALSQLMTTLQHEDVKQACIYALVNLAGIPRAVTCDSILNTLVTLAKSGSSETRRACARSLLNLSILPTTRSNIVEEGAILAMAVLAESKEMVLLEMISCVLCNLSAIKTNQELMVKNGALEIVILMLDCVQAAFQRVNEETNEDVEDEDNEQNDQKQKQISNGTSTTKVKDPAVDEAIAAATALLLRIRKNGANVVAFFCCNPKLQYRVVSAGFVPKLLRMLQDADGSGAGRRIDDDTEKFCIIGLANLALDERCRQPIVQDGTLPYLLRIVNDSQRQDLNSLLLKLDCVTALSNLMLHPLNFKRMVDEGVVPALLALVQNSLNPDIQKACIYAMLNLAKDPSMKTRLAESTTDKEQGAIPVMLQFASKQILNAELCGVCIAFLHHLSTRQENYDVLYYEGAVDLLVRVLSKRSSAEPVAVIYSLWLDCMATLANMASHSTRRATLVDDGVIEAIQHVLSSSSADSRRRDPKTDSKIVKTQFAAAQILFKLHERCSQTKQEIPAFFASLLLLATQSASKNSRLDRQAVLTQQKTTLRCSLTIAKVSLATRGLRLLAGHVDIPPALNGIMRTGLHEAQVCAAIALCNLATERGQLKKRLWRDSTVDDFIVITLLRVNSDQTKAICAKALFNLLSHEDTRDQMVQDGVLYALIKLARLESEEVRDLSLRSIYNLSLDAAKATQLLEMEIVRILTKMYQAEYSKDMKRLVCGVLSNLSSVPGGHEQQMLHEGVLTILKNLVKVRDPETKVYAANILHNLACCEDVAEQLVRDEANVLAILVTELKSENKDVRRYAAATLASLSSNSIAVTLMTQESLVVILNDIMKRSMASCVATTSSCVFVLRNLFSLMANQCKFIECNGVPTLAAILACKEMETETQTQQMAADMLCALANLDTREDGGEPLEERLVRDGIVRALVTIVKGMDQQSETSSASNKAASLNIISSLCNLSKNVKCHELMLRDGVLDAVALLSKTTPNDPRSAYRGLESVKGEDYALQCAILLRNLSRLDPESSTPSTPSGSDRQIAASSAAAAALSAANEVKMQRIGAQPAFVQLLFALSLCSSQNTREHVVVGLYNAARNRRCRMQMIKHDGVKVLLRMGTNAATPVKRHICALALQSLSKQEDGTVDPHTANIIQEGLVTAIAALADAHQPEVLVAAVTLLQAVVPPPVAARSKNSSSVALVSANNTAITPKRSPPDWTKVVIDSMAGWPELESRATSPVTRTGSADVGLRSSSSARGQIGDGNNSDGGGADDSYSDYSDSDDEDEKEHRQHTKAKQQQRATTAPSPASGSKGSGLVTTPTLSGPRTCNSDMVLGTFQLLVDQTMEKVKVNVDAELAVRRMTGTLTSSSLSGLTDELPKLRPVTAPDEAEQQEVRRSTLTHVRHQAYEARGSTAIASPGSPNSRNAAVRDSFPSVSSPSKSPATPKRKSRLLEPLTASAPTLPY